jgi:hypothetical protein
MPALGLFRAGCQNVNPVKLQILVGSFALLVVKEWVGPEYFGIRPYALGSGVYWAWVLSSKIPLLHVRV